MQLRTPFLLIFQGVSSAVVQIILEAIYKRKLKLTSGNVTEVLAGAHMMQIGPILEQCEKFVQIHMNAKICLQYLKLAELYNLGGGVLLAAEHCFLNNFKKVSEDDAFLELSIDALGKYLNSDIIHCKEIEVFNCAMKWIEHSPDRKEHAKDLFQWIRLGLVSTEELMGRIASHHLIRDDAFCQELIHKAIMYKSDLYSQPLYCGIINKPRGKDIQVCTRDCKCVAPPHHNHSTFHVREESESDFMFYDYESRTKLFRNSVKVPFARRSISFVVNKYMNFLFLHGVDSRSFSNTLMRFDCSTHKWITLSGIPQDATIRYSMVMLGGKMLIVGGYVIKRESRITDKSDSITPRMKNTVWQYDIAANDWEKLSDFPHKVYNMGACVYENELFVFGGCLEGDSWTYSDKTYKYMQDQDIWVRQTSMVTARQFYYKAFTEVEDGFVVVGAGTGSQAVSEMYTVATDQWCTVEVPGHISNRLNPLSPLFMAAVGGSVFVYANMKPPLIFRASTKKWEESLISLIPTGAASAIVRTFKPL